MSSQERPRSRDLLYVAVRRVLVGVAAGVLVVVSAACQPSASGGSSTNRLLDGGVVLTIKQSDSQKPVAIVFDRHASYYFLDRTDPHFSQWLAILKESQQNHVPVRFDCVADGPRLTAVELKERHGVFPPSWSEGKAP
jgi:hypothetical protein